MNKTGFVNASEHAKIKVAAVNVLLALPCPCFTASVTNQPAFERRLSPPQHRKTLPRLQLVTVQGFAVCPNLPFGLCPRLWDEAHMPEADADDARLYGSDTAGSAPGAAWLLILAGLISMAALVPSGGTTAGRRSRVCGSAALLGSIIGLYLAVQLFPAQTLLQVRLQCALQLLPPQPLGCAWLQSLQLFPTQLMLWLWLQSAFMHNCKGLQQFSAPSYLLCMAAKHTPADSCSKPPSTMAAKRFHHSSISKLLLQDSIGGCALTIHQDQLPPGLQLPASTAFKTLILDGTDNPLKESPLEKEALAAQHTSGSLHLNMCSFGRVKGCIKTWMEAIPQTSCSDFAVIKAHSLLITSTALC